MDATAHQNNWPNTKLRVLQERQIDSLIRSPKLLNLPGKLFLRDYSGKAGLEG